MSLENFLSKLRIEIRIKPTPGAEDSVPWSVLDLAETPEQAAGKLKRARLGEEIESRVLANEPIDSLPSTDTTERDSLLATLEQQAREMMDLKRKLNVAEIELAKFRTKPVEPVDAIADVAPLPFEVGDKLRDIHTNAVVTVLALNKKLRPDLPGGEFNLEEPSMWIDCPGFTWETADEIDFCPLVSVGCYVPVDAKA